MYPVLFQVGPLVIKTFVVLLIAAYVTAKFLTSREADRKGLDPQLIQELGPTALLVGFVGARLYFVALFDPLWYLSRPAEILVFWRGGLSLDGALLAGWATAVWFCRRRGVSFWRLADSIVPGLLLGQAIGRLGSFLNGDGYGVPTDLPWAVTFTDPNSLAPLQIPLHPTQLYEMAADLIIFAGLMVARSRLQQEGALFWSYAVSYALARAVIDLLRGDVLWVGETVRMSHVLAATIVGMAFIAFMRPSVFHMTTSTMGREKLRV